MLEIWTNFNVVLDLFKMGGAAWPVTCAAMIKLILSLLKSELGPVKKAVGGFMRLYNALPIPDFRDYHQAMNASVWFLAGMLGVLTYVTGGHSWSEAALAFGSGGFQAFGVHETAEAWLPKPVDASGGQSPVRLPPSPPDS